MRTGAAVRGRSARCGYTVLNEVVSNQVLVSFGDAETTQQVIAAIQQEGTAWAGDGLAWAGGDAHQRVELGNDRGRRGSQPESDPPRGE